MARLTGSITPKDKDGNQIDVTARSEGSSNAFKLIDPGFYNAFVSGLGFGTYQAAFKGFPNPATKDGKWTYGKLTPQLVLDNEEHTQINKQDTVLGVLVDNTPFQPRGNDESPVWKEAVYLLSALGLFATDGDGVFKLDFDPDFVKDRVIRVKVGLGGYIKSGEHRGNFKPEQITEMLKTVNGGVPYEGFQIPQLLNSWNFENGLTNELDEEIEEGVSLKLKNFVVNYYGINEDEASKNGWYFDPITKAVFISEEAFNAYENVKDNEGTPANGEKPW